MMLNFVELFKFLTWVFTVKFIQIYQYQSSSQIKMLYVKFRQVLQFSIQFNYLFLTDKTLGQIFNIYIRYIIMIISINV